MAYLSATIIDSKTVSFEIEVKLVRDNDSEPWLLQPINGMEDFGRQLHFPVMQNGFAKEVLKDELLRYLSEYFAGPLIIMSDEAKSRGIAPLIKLERGEQGKLNVVFAHPYLRRENGVAKAAQERNLTIRITDEELRSCRIPDVEKTRSKTRS
ncbi:MAG: hypothetical protein LVQ95_04640 [Candidatus Micrarchaeales archaeon]|nr:hypothetical protein [Candidatus Micrarchaeales archaeon]